MTTSEAAALGDLRDRLDLLQQDVRRLESYGCATLNALSLLSPKIGEAVRAALATPAAAGHGDPRQADLFAAPLEVQALARPDGKLASALEQALVQAAAELDENAA